MRTYHVVNTYLPSNVNNSKYVRRYVYSQLTRKRETEKGENFQSRFHFRGTENIITSPIIILQLPALMNIASYAMAAAVKGERKKPFIIGIAGGTGAGKTTFAQSIYAGFGGKGWGGKSDATTTRDGVVVGDGVGSIAYLSHDH